MATTIVRDIPDPLYEKIKQSALKNRRSINSEIIFLLEAAANLSSPSSSTKRLELIRNVRLSVGSDKVISAAEITAAKNEGRL
ncbi:MAG: Arc family DNA-binding protein [Cyanobacteria bacterium P01_A01_bin.83]